MFERTVVSRLAARLKEPRRFIQIVVGPRQTGKTTAVTQTIEKLRMQTHFVSADDPRLASAEWLRNEWHQARALFILGSGYSAQELSFTKMLGQLQDTGNTVTLAHYLELLAKADLLTGLQNYAGNKLRARKSSPRLMVFDISLMTYADGTNRRRLLDDAAYRGRLVESAVGAYLLARGKEEGFEVYWWRERNREVDFVIQKGRRLTAIEVKSGRVKNVGGGLVFKALYPEAFSLVVGGANLPLADFLSGSQPLFP
jgi:predicted AAA+ superfamily ATPase